MAFMFQLKGVVHIMQSESTFMTAPSRPDGQTDRNKDEAGMLGLPAAVEVREIFEYITKLR